MLVQHNTATAPCTIALRPTWCCCNQCSDALLRACEGVLMLMQCHDVVAMSVHQHHMMWWWCWDDNTIMMHDSNDIMTWLQSWCNDVTSAWCDAMLATWSCHDMMIRSWTADDMITSWRDDCMMCRWLHDVYFIASSCCEMTAAWCDEHHTLTSAPGCNVSTNSYSHNLMLMLRCQLVVVMITTNK